MFRRRPPRPAISAEVVPLSRAQLLGFLAGLLLVGGVLLYGLGYTLVSSFSAGTAPNGVQSSAHADADPAQRRDTIAAAPMATVAEDAGIAAPSGCRMGICHACLTPLRSGQVTDLRTGQVHGEPGELVQTCVSASAGPLSLGL